jgi:CRISPR system Cascade subunit CasA
MNLLTNKWIPVQKSKVKSVITVSEITHPDIIDLDFTRSDFNASIKNFLIGILQTTFAPKTEAEWVSKFKNPPSSQELEKTFKPFVEFFNLFGASPDQPLFLQDTAIQDEKGCQKWPVQAIFTDGPRKKTIDDGKDFFKRDGAISSICPSCSAALLYTVQTMAWTGGKGYYTSIRSGNTNILTAIAEGDNLWETLWLNVLPKKEMGAFGTPGELLFP